LRRIPRRLVNVHVQILGLIGSICIVAAINDIFCNFYAGKNFILIALEALAQPDTYYEKGAYAYSPSTHNAKLCTSCETARGMDCNQSFGSAIVVLGRLDQTKNPVFALCARLS
jgi:hypothetical protein